MNLLLEIYNKLILNEAVNGNSVTDSIKNRYQVTINYEGDPSHGVAPGIRTVEVYAYGLTTAGNPVIRAYQPYGDTVTIVPGWKFFRLDRIKSWKPTFKIITTPAQGFNPNGDKLMSTVYAVADFTKPADLSNATGPKQTPKQVGYLDNIDKILADREKEKNTSREQQRTASRFSPKPKATNEPEIKGVEQSQSQTIQEPEVKGIEQEPEAEVSGQPMPTEEPKSDVFKTKGEEELDKVKDLNRRLDQARKIDLSKIPKR